MAAIIGSIAGVLVILAFNFIDTKLKVDDPVGAIAVHGVNGIWGVLCIGLFANGKYGAGWNLTTEGPGASASGVTGVFYDASLGLKQLGAQAIGALVICTVFVGLAYGFFKLQNAIMKGGIRPPAEMEVAGMDLPEMGVLAYPEFEPFPAVSRNGESAPSGEEEPEPVNA